MEQLYFVERKINGLVRGYFIEDYNIASKFAKSGENITEISMGGAISLEDVIGYLKEENINFKKIGQRKPILKIPDVSVLESFF